MNNTVIRIVKVRLIGVLALACLVAPLPLAADGTVECNVNAAFPTNSTECGVNATASGQFSTALGYTVNATGSRTLAAGRLSEASGDDSTAVGHDADASAQSATAIGQGSEAAELNSTAVGRNARASAGAVGSLAVGAESDATAVGATALGGDGDDGGLTGAQAVALNGTAVGSDSVVNAANGTALGNRAVASNVGSTAIGAGATTAKDNAIILGKWSGPVFVGIGTNAPNDLLHLKRSDGTARLLIEEANVEQGPRDLFEISNNGNPEFRMTNIGNNNSWVFSAGLRFVVKNDAGEWVSRIDANGDMELSGVLTELSDVNAKQDIVPVDGQSILNKLESLDISEWSYKDTPSNRHVGPMAQDFHAAFGLGHTDTGIATLDSSGIALAAIKALIKENEALKQRVVELEVQNNRVSKLEAIVDQLVSEGKMQLVGN